MGTPGDPEASTSPVRPRSPTEGEPQDEPSSPLDYEGHISLSPLGSVTIHPFPVDPSTATPDSSFAQSSGQFGSPCFGFSLGFNLGICQTDTG